MADLSIVIPCYNEAQNIPLILERLKAVYDSCNDVEIILVDNGSSDNTAEVLKNNIDDKKYSFVTCHRVENNIGYGNGILSGLKQAHGKYLAWTHADMQTDPVDVVTAYKVLKSENDEQCIVKGKRKNRGLLDNFFTFGMSIITLLFLKKWYHDINAQPKVFSREFYNKLDKAPHDFSLDLYLLFVAKSMKYKTLTIPVFFNKRQYGEAKGGGSLKTKWSLIKRTFSYILKLKTEYKIG